MPYRDPEQSRAYQREYRQLRRAGDGCTTPGTTLVPLAFRLKTAADVLALLEEQVDASRETLSEGAGPRGTDAAPPSEAPPMSPAVERLVEDALQEV
jgi:hypothetical protein